MRSNFRRVAVPQQARQALTPKTFPAPTRGLIANENLMMAGAGGAVLMENWFPTQATIRLRGGSQRRATIGGTRVESLFTYSAGAFKLLFAANATNIFNVTSVANPLVPPAAAVSGQTAGHYSTVHMINASGDTYLIAVNGLDAPLSFNGTTWTKMNAASTPPLTGATGLSQVWKYRNRLFFVQGSGLNAYYLPINAIGGELVKLPLASTFAKGGSLVFGGTWSLDAGDGMDDKCVFVTSEGEVAVFVGSDPSNINDWAIQGRYDIGKPLGKNGFMQVGGDLLILTEDGIVPLSQVTVKDPAALSLAAVTRPIEPIWKAEVLQRASRPWEVIKWTPKNMAIVAPPKTGAQESYCYAVNLQTGAWTKFTGWDTQCLTTYDNLAFFGTSDGRVMQCEIGGDDDGEPYVATVVGLYDHLDAMGYIKTVHMARSVFKAVQPFEARVSGSTNYQIDLPAPPNSGASSSIPGLWDVGLWDVSLWDAEGGMQQVSTRWQSIGRSGFSFAYQVQVTCTGLNLPDAELLGVDLTFETGALVL